MSREAAEELFQEWQRTKTRRAGAQETDRGEEIMRVYNQRLKDRYLEHKPRARKFDDEKIHKFLLKHDEEWAKEIVKETQKEIEDYCAELRDAENAAKDALKAAASKDLLRSGEPTLWQSVTDTTYQTQGFSAEKYAQGAAERYADHARFYGVQTQVRRVGQVVRPPPSPFGKALTLVDYQVWVNVKSKFDLAILDLLPGPDLVEIVRLHWARGCNPRVYMPFLPHGFERENNLDYFGNKTA